MFSKALLDTWRHQHPIEITLVNTQGKIEIDWNETPVKVYRPINNETSTDLFIHGVGFALGNVEMYDSLIERMKYLLSPETVFPGEIQDCEAIIDYFFKFENAKFGVNT